MLDSKFVFTLVGLIVAVVSICNADISPSFIEKFGLAPPANGQAYATRNTCGDGTGKTEIHAYANSIPSALPPRMSSTGISAAVNYDMPNVANQAFDPMGFAAMVKNGPFCGTGGEVRPGKQMPADYPNSNDLIDSGDMNTFGADTIPQVYTREIYSNKKSRTAAQSDPIRGDVWIPPNTGNESFITSEARDSNNLGVGAMGVLAGAMDFNSGSETVDKVSSPEKQFMAKRFNLGSVSGMGDLNVNSCQ